MLDLNKRENLSQEEQLAIIAEVEKDFEKFLAKDFDNSVFLKCRDNFSLTKDVQSIQFIKQGLTSRPKFTIAIPTYKRINELKRALESALNQDICEEYEILVVENTDDFESNSLQKMLEENFNGKINYYRNVSNLGVFGNWNRCLSLAQGEWVCLLHSDDEIMSNYLSEMNKMLNIVKSKEPILIGCVADLKEVFPPIKESKIKYKVSYFFQKIFLPKKTLFEKTISAQKWKKEALRDELVFLPPNALLHNKNKCLKLGGYNSDEDPVADQVFVNRMHKNGTIFLYRKAILQKKHNEVSFGLTPKCLIQMAFIELPIFLVFMKSKKLATRAAFAQIRNARLKLKKNNCFILSNYLKQFCIKHQIKKHFYYINKLIAKIKNYKEF